MRNAGLTTPVAYWTSWADALGMIKLRIHSMAAAILDVLSGGSSEGCLRKFQDAAALLRREGFDDLPSWTELADGKRPPPLPRQLTAAERTPGWQHFASSYLDHSTRTRILFSLYQTVPSCGLKLAWELRRRSRLLIFVLQGHHLSTRCFTFANSETCLVAAAVL